METLRFDLGKTDILEFELKNFNAVLIKEV